MFYFIIYSSEYLQQTCSFYDKQSSIWCTADLLVSIDRSIQQTTQLYNSRTTTLSTVSLWSYAVWQRAGSYPSRHWVLDRCNCPNGCAGCDGASAWTWYVMSSTSSASWWGRHYRRTRGTYRPLTASRCGTKRWFVAGQESKRHRQHPINHHSKPSLSYCCICLVWWVEKKSTFWSHFRSSFFSVSRSKEIVKILVWRSQFVNILV